MRSLFVMDPLERIQVAGDSTFVLMRESCDRGHPVWFCTPDRLGARDGVASARVVRVRVTADAPHFHPAESAELPLSAFDVVWMRKDPPFDMGYVFATYLLDMADGPLVLNDPAGLKLFNEKLWAMRFPALHPPTVLSRDPDAIRAFAREQLPNRIVLKPWDGNGGRGVVVTRADDRNLNALVEVLTGLGTHHLIAQAYLPGVEAGDKRILLFDGEPVGAILRVPGEHDHRGNMHVGARVEPTELDERDLEICGVLAPELRRWGMLFVGIDVIQGYLTEINVTSPTGLREAERLYGTRLESDLIDRVERRVAARREP